MAHENGASPEAAFLHTQYVFMSDLITELVLTAQRSCGTLRKRMWEGNTLLKEPRQELAVWPQLIGGLRKLDSNDPKGTFLGVGGGGEECFQVVDHTGVCKDVVQPSPSDKEHLTL